MITAMKIEQSEAWAERDKEAAAPFSRVHYYPLAVRRGHGAVIEDVDGNEYIDLLSSAASSNLGHGHPAIIEAVRTQMEDYTQYTNGYFYNPVTVELAEELAAITPGDFKKKTAFGLSGADSMDGAIKLARAATSRSNIIAFEGAYHGTTYGAASLSFISQSMRRKIGPMLPDIHVFPFPNTYRDGKKAGDECLKRIEKALETWLPPDDTAAVAIEPIQGDSGLLVPPPDFYQKLAEICKQHGIIVICDEVQQGCMRTGKWFGIEHFGIEPDIIVAGKALGGGFPLSAIIARSEIMDAIEAPGHILTMGGNAACCAAGLASLREMGKPGFREGVVNRSARMRTRLEKMAERFRCIGDIRGIGFSIGVEIVADR